MQPRLTVDILVLQSERLVHVLVNPLIFFFFFPAGVVAEPYEVAVLIGHLTWNADFVAAEVAGLLAAFAVFVGPVAYLCQGVVAVVL